MFFLKPYKKNTKKVWFFIKIVDFGSAFSLIFGKNMVWFKSDFSFFWSDILIGSTAEVYSECDKVRNPRV